MERVRRKQRSETQISAASDDTKRSEDRGICGEGNIVGSGQVFGLFMGFIYVLFCKI